MNPLLREGVLDLAEGTLAGTVPPDEAVQRLRQLGGGEGIEADVVHFLYHYLADADIRGRDPNYDHEQRRHLAGLIDSLRRAK